MRRFSRASLRRDRVELHADHVEVVRSRWVSGETSASGFDVEVLQVAQPPWTKQKLRSNGSVLFPSLRYITGAWTLYGPIEHPGEHAVDSSAPLGPIA